MNDEYWEVKRNCYACICITPEFNGTCVVWNTLEEAWQDAKERVDDCINGDFQHFRYEKVHDGYEVYQGRLLVRCYKVFEAQELE